MLCNFGPSKTIHSPKITLTSSYKTTTFLTPQPSNKPLFAAFPCWEAMLRRETQGKVICLPGYHQWTNLSYGKMTCVAETCRAHGRPLLERWAGGVLQEIRRTTIKEFGVLFLQHLQKKSVISISTALRMMRTIWKLTIEQNLCYACPSNWIGVITDGFKKKNVHIILVSLSSNLQL